ncbi:hypothetical protein, variant [Exophiala sideris]|uniref:Zn(2)-C6 fungal-type domain-containing protein n=1 Tax=Exophiala sideris TaxID=1016849 RepID=A0A0D1YU23_9EURO|nr:hypothetical protein PV11_00728 [Exophiala sideris]KIV84985.1 hypothetical protein, variant [Exophiala sideris]
MAPDKPLPVETLLPFSHSRSPETLSFLHNAERRDSNLNDESPDSPDDNELSENGTEKPKREKRSRACVACRNMKIRCLPVEGQEACRACSKVNRECVMPGPPRKRQKTVHKVAELEKKINALTDALLAKQQAEPSPPESTEKDQLTTASSVASRVDDNYNAKTNHISQNLVTQLMDAPSMRSAMQPLDLSTSCHALDRDPQAKDNYVDVVERGLLSMDTAVTMFDYWTHKMCTTCPIVVFAPSTKVQEVRERRPMTFLAILAITSPVVMPSIQPDLTVDLARQLSERVLFHGEKSVDMVHALLMHASYYIRPRNARDLAFNQYISTAIVMSYETGIGKRSNIRRGMPLAQKIESARTWLSVFHASISTCTIMRTPSNVRTDARFDECLQILDNAQDAPTPNKWLCAMARLSRIAQEVTEAFNMCDHGADLDFLDSRTQYQLKYFQRQLQDWERSVDVDVDRRLLIHQSSCINLYMHEIALHQDHNVDDFHHTHLDWERKESKNAITSLHIDALTTLLQSSHKILDTYLSLEASCARSLPNLYIVWNAYAMVILIKIHWLVNNPELKIGSILAADIRTEFYLDAIQTKLNELSADGHSPCAEAFGFVFKKLKIWHFHRGGLNSDDEQGGNNEESRRQRGLQIFQAEPMSFLSSVKAADLPPTSSSSASGMQQPQGSGNFFASSAVFAAADTSGSNLNAAYDAASYGNTNWDQFNFSTEEMDMFDVYMNNSGWMGYLL